MDLVKTNYNLEAYSILENKVFLFLLKQMLKVVKILIKILS